MGLWDIPAKHEISDTELRFNPYHDPTTGRFTAANGGGGGFLYVGKGQKGKGAYVFERDIDSEYEKWQKDKAAKSKEHDYFIQKTEFYASYGKNIDIKVGYTPSSPLPKIEGVSEKQINYASDLRNSYINSKLSGAYSKVSSAYGRAGLDENKVSQMLKASGFNSMDDFVQKYVEDDTVKYLQKEKSARNIIDKLR